jgi:hypothetical protein
MRHQTRATMLNWQLELIYDRFDRTVSENPKNRSILLPKIGSTARILGKLKAFKAFPLDPWVQKNVGRL